MWNKSIKNSQNVVDKNMRVVYIVNDTKRDKKGAIIWTVIQSLENLLI